MHFQSVLAAVVFTTLALAAPSHHKKKGGKLEFIGVNESGPEFGATNLPGDYGTDYTWPTLSTIDTFVSKGMNTFRINTLMERMAPNSMTGTLDAAYMGNLTETVNYITRKGAYALICPHNYGRYNGAIITSTSAFRSFRHNVAKHYTSNHKVIFDTNNEYHDMSGELVAQLNQAAIHGIRAAGARSQWITVEGNAYTGAWTWTTATGTDGKTNAQTMGGLKDPEDKIIYQMHQYLDSDGSGTSTTCVSSTIGSERLVAATQWLRQNRKMGMVGEFAGAVNGVCEEAVRDMMGYVEKNSDVWTGALWWAAGPWWAVS